MAFRPSAATNERINTDLDPRYTRALRAALPPCKGRLCGCTDGVSHSAICQDDHESAINGHRPALLVMYEPQAPDEAPRQLVIDRFEPKLMETWVKRIDEGHIDTVILAGRSMVHGWRMVVKRRVRFESTQYVGQDQMAYQAQASNRIVSQSYYDDLKFVPVSPTTGRHVAPYRPPIQQVSRISRPGLVQARPLIIDPKTPLTDVREAHETAEKLAALYRESYPGIRRKWIEGDWYYND